MESNEAKDLVGVDIPSRKHQRKIVSHANKDRPSKSGAIGADQNLSTASH